MRDYPLFIIDNSRAHGRGCPECDFLACTSHELPFIAAVTVLYEEEYLEHHDTGDFVLYSDSKNDMRISIHVIEIQIDYDAGLLRSLLKRAIKEISIRRKVVEVPFDNITDDQAIFFCELNRSAIIEKIRKDKNDMRSRLAYSIFSKIIDDYQILKKYVRNREGR